MMTMMSVTVTSQCGSVPCHNIIYVICIICNLKVCVLCVSKLSWGHSSFYLRSFSSCPHSEREGFIFCPFFQMGGIKAFPRPAAPQPHAPQPWPLTCHLGGLWWTLAAGVGLGGARLCLYQALVLTPVEKREAQFKRAHGWRWQMAKRVLEFSMGTGLSAAGASGRAPEDTLTWYGAGIGHWGRKCFESVLPYRAHSCY